MTVDRSWTIWHEYKNERHRFSSKNKELYNEAKAQEALNGSVVHSPQTFTLSMGYFCVW